MMFCRLLVFFLVFVFSACNPAAAWEARLPETALDESLILVDKGEDEFFYLEKKGGEIIRLHYPSIHGEKEGDKQVEGDLKTPEGVYFVRGKIQVPLDFEMYGNHAYVLNYPNPIDKLRGKTGGGIWIHSKGNPIEGQVTQGCVAIDLADIEFLGKYLQSGTPVVIAQGIHSGFHKEKMLAKKKNVKKLSGETSVKSSASALTEAEADIVSQTDNLEKGALEVKEEKSLFSEFFLPQEKEHIGNASEKNKAVETDEPLEPAEYAEMNGQNGQAGNVSPTGSAAVSAATSPTVPAYKTEETFHVGKDEQARFDTAEAGQDGEKAISAPYVAEPVEVSDDELYIRQATLDWNNAWAERSAEFFTFYDKENYSKTSGSFEKFKAQKQGLFETLSWIYIAAGEVEVLQGPDYYVSWFKQWYVAPNHKTEGIRRLYWLKDGETGEYKIAAMEWLPKAVGLENMLSDKIKNEAPKFIEEWRLAWERADIEKYASFYGQHSVQDNRRGLNEIVGQKNEIWSVKKPKKVVFSDLNMTMEKDGLKVSMRQDYEDSSGYKDKGMKILTLHPKGDGWVIHKEIWRRL